MFARITNSLFLQKESVVSANDGVKDLFSSPDNFLKDKKVYFPIIGNPEISQNPRKHFDTLQMKAKLSIDPNYDGALLIEKGSSTDELKNVLYTGMREEGHESRTKPTNKVSALNNDLWVTDQQTGCIVCILDWGDGIYSMLHVQPRNGFENTEIEDPSDFLDKNPVEFSNRQDKAIESDIFKALDGMIPEVGVKPHCAFVRSAERYHCEDKVTAVVGVSNGERFDFYEQISVAGAMIPSEVSKIEMKTWPDSY